MYPLLPLHETSLLCAGCALLTAVATASYDDRLFGRRWFVGGAAALFGTMALGLGLWRSDSVQASAWGVNLVWTLLPTVALTAVALLLAAPLNRVLQRLKARRARHEVRASSRRRFLWNAAAALPLGAFSAGAAGMSNNDDTRLVHIPMKFRDLPPALAGLRILQLSDLHLGAGRHAVDLQRLLEALRADPPDLIVLTGDVADKLEELEAALELVTAFAPRLGVYAALGNHEYLNDIEQMRPAYERSAVRLLVNESAVVKVGDAELFLAGVDDPMFFKAPQDFFERAVAECAVAAPAAAFRLLLCHRPTGFPAAARAGFHLTLSGHTHGGQVGLLGRSLFEVCLGMPYLWGAYRRGESRLYTTAGFGHWFPFRLNCPPEAPIIVLERA